MSIEHFVSIIDRARIDEVLALTWQEFNHRYKWRKDSEWPSAKNFLLEFALVEQDSQPINQSMVDDIVDRRTLRWTMNRCSPRLFFMYEILNHVPELKGRWEMFSPRALDDLSIVHAVATEAFIRNDISQATFFSVLRFCERLSLGDAVDLKKAHYKGVVQALKSWIPSMPPFRWLTLDYFGEGYACLNLQETKSVVRFLQRAWEGNWPALHLSDWAKEEIRIDRGLLDAADFTIRDSEVARQVLSWFRSPKRSGMCLISYIEAT